MPQVEKMCIDKGLTDETEILRFLQNGTLVGLLPVPHPILIRRYQVIIFDGTIIVMVKVIIVKTTIIKKIFLHTISFYFLMQANRATELWFQTYMWGVVYLRSASPPLWAETSVKMFTVQRV